MFGMKLKRIFTVIWLILLGKGWAFAHPLCFVTPVRVVPMDSVVLDSLDKAIQQYEKTNPYKALAFLHHKIKVLSKGKANESLFTTYLLQGGILRLQQRYEEASKAYENAAIIAKELANVLYQAKVLTNMGNICVYQGDYYGALKSFFQALDVYEKCKESQSIELVNSSIGSLFALTRNFDLALEYYKKVSDRLELRGERGRPMGILLNNMGWAQYQLGNYKEAREYYLKGNARFEALSELFFLVSGCRDLAKIELELGNIEVAKQLALKSLKLNDKLRINEGELESKMILANTMSVANLDGKIELLMPFWDEIHSYKSTAIKSDYFELMYTIFKLKGAVKRALGAHEMYARYNDSVNAEIYRFNIVTEHMKREYKMQMMQARSVHEFEKQQLRHSQLIVIMAASMSAFLVVGFFLWILQRTRQRNRYKLQQLYSEFEKLKLSASNQWATPLSDVQLNKGQIEIFIGQKLNETDWRVLNVLLLDPMQTNISMAEKVFLSKDGLGSSLKRMYELFDIQETKYKKLALISRAIAYSKS